MAACVCGFKFFSGIDRHAAECPIAVLTKEKDALALQLSEAEKLKQGYYDEAAKGWQKFRDAERQIGEAREERDLAEQNLENANARALERDAQIGELRAKVKDVERLNQELQKALLCDCTVCQDQTYCKEAITVVLKCQEKRNVSSKNEVTCPHCKHPSGVHGIITGICKETNCECGR